MLDIKAQTRAGDARVASALGRLNLKYEITDNGDFLVPFETESGRSQAAIICSGTYDFSGQELRAICSTAFTFKEELSSDAANYLLACNHLVKMGAWEIAPAEGNRENGLMVAFRTNVDADLTGEPLLNLIMAVVWSADDLQTKMSDRENN